jgi:hypothetical protein
MFKNDGGVALSIRVTPPCELISFVAKPELP